MPSIHFPFRRKRQEPSPPPPLATGAGANAGQVLQVPSAISQAGLQAFTGELGTASQVPDLETMSDYNSPDQLPSNEKQVNTQ